MKIPRENVPMSETLKKRLFPQEELTHNTSTVKDLLLFRATNFHDNFFNFPPCHQIRHLTKQTCGCILHKEVFLSFPAFMP